MMRVMTRGLAILALLLTLGVIFIPELFLVFVQSRWNADFTSQKEFDRDFLRIIFDDGLEKFFTPEVRS